MLRVGDKDIEYAVQHRTGENVNIYLQQVNTQTQSNYIVADSGIPCEFVPEQRYFIGVPGVGTQSIQIDAEVFQYSQQTNEIQIIQISEQLAIAVYGDL